MKLLSQMGLFTRRFPRIRRVDQSSYDVEFKDYVCRVSYEVAAAAPSLTIFRGQSLQMNDLRPEQVDHAIKELQREFVNGGFKVEIADD